MILNAFNTESLESKAFRIGDEALVENDFEEDYSKV